MCVCVCFFLEGGSGSVGFPDEFAVFLKGLKVALKDGGGLGV